MSEVLREKIKIKYINLYLSKKIKKLLHELSFFKTSKYELKEKKQNTDEIDLKISKALSAVKVHREVAYYMKDFSTYSDIYAWIDSYNNYNLKKKTKIDDLTKTINSNKFEDETKINELKNQINIYLYEIEVSSKLINEINEILSKDNVEEMNL